MSYILFPGRHHLLTNFQLEYLTMITHARPVDLVDLNNQPLKITDPLDTIIWAVTSSNHANTRRNPLPADRREVAIERFSNLVGTTSFTYLIDDLGHSNHFADYILKKIEVESGGRHILTPANTVIACSTPEVIKMYLELGFQVLPMELTNINKETYSTKRPWEIVEQIVHDAQQGIDWRTNKEFLTKVAKPTRELYLKYNFGDLIIDLFEDPILGSDGDLTDTRNYRAYEQAFETGAERKYNMVRNFIRPGRVVDIGCATGSIIKQMSEDDRLRESDLFGIEVSRRLYSICEQRKENGEFGNDNVFFYQRNIVHRKVFSDNSINTFTAFSLTHELESYAGRESLLTFLKQVYDQLRPGGVFIDLDVVGPENKDQVVKLRLNQTDGNNQLQEKLDSLSTEQVNKYVDGLSTYSRFLQFVRDFRHEEGHKVDYQIVEEDGEKLIKTSLYNAAEFISKKDYTGNWQSEMHETFCFWSFSDWEKALKEVGFILTPNSHTFTNEWIVDNRYKGKAEIVGQDYPPTNIVIVAEKKV